MRETSEGNKPVAGDKVTAGQELGNCTCSMLQLNTAPVLKFVTRNSGKEHSKHYLSHVTNNQSLLHEL